MPYRHLPILGFDFKENKEVFLSNCLAQIYDLLINTYNTYYLKTKDKINSQKRSRKIMSRIFEASKYALFISQTKELEDIQERIVHQKDKKCDLNKSKKLFIEFVDYYHKLLKNNQYLPTPSTNSFG